VSATEVGALCVLRALLASRLFTLNPLFLVDSESKTNRILDGVRYSYVGHLLQNKVCIELSRSGWISAAGSK
jgi:hypothetical protein